MNTINASPTQLRLHAELTTRGVRHRFVHAPHNYYSRNLLYRKYETAHTIIPPTSTVYRDVLGAASVFHLCKSIVFENTKAPPDVVDCSNPRNSKYYLVITQYAYKLVCDAACIPPPTCTSFYMRRSITTTRNTPGHHQARHILAQAQRRLHRAPLFQAPCGSRGGWVLTDWIWAQRGVACGHGHATANHRGVDHSCAQARCVLDGWRRGVWLLHWCNVVCVHTYIWSPFTTSIVTNLLLILPLLLPTCHLPPLGYTITFATCRCM